MKQATLAVLLAAGAIVAGCKSNDPKPEDTAPPPAQAAAAQPAPEPAKPECPPADKSTKKKKKKSSKKADAPPTDCEPAPAKTEASPPPPPPAKDSTAGKACNPCVVKSKDGTYDGEVYGNIPPGSKWSRLQIGMTQIEVERILGATPNIRAYVTGKAFIPFYYGTDRHRYEAVYAGQGSVAYTGGSFGGGAGILMMINYDPKIQ